MFDFYFKMGEGVYFLSSRTNLLNHVKLRLCFSSNMYFVVTVDFVVDTLHFVQDRIGERGVTTAKNLCMQT